jgi:ATP-dependent exoDNAse (exonuclease V) alpha subunit
VGMGTFEYGQAYVALSRITSLEALYIHEFDPRAFRVHPKVRAFYNQLAAIFGAQQSVKTVSLDCQTAVQSLDCQTAQQSLDCQTAQQSLDCQTASLETSPVTPSSCTDSVASIP